MTIMNDESGSPSVVILFWHSPGGIPRRRPLPGFEPGEFE